MEAEEREGRRRVEMSKNLIEVLFQTEKDKELERLKKEKAKLKISFNHALRNS